MLQSFVFTLGISLYGHNIHSTDVQKLQMFEDFHNLLSVCYYFVVFSIPFLFEPDSKHSLFLESWCHLFVISNIAKLEWPHLCLLTQLHEQWSKYFRLSCLSIYNKGQTLEHPLPGSVESVNNILISIVQLHTFSKIYTRRVFFRPVLYLFFHVHICPR